MMAHIEPSRMSLYSFLKYPFSNLLGTKEKRMPAMGFMKANEKPTQDPTFMARSSLSLLSSEKEKTKAKQTAPIKTLGASPPKAKPIRKERVQVTKEKMMALMKRKWTPLSMK